MLKIDFFVLEQVVCELQSQIIGASLTKVHQPGDDSLVLRFWNGRQTLKLLLQVGSSARLHLTQREYTNPFQPPRFSQLLRSRLKRLQSVELLGYERVVDFGFAGTDQHYHLICELIGSRSNLYLFDESGQLVDALHKPQTMGERQLRRGDAYVPLTSSGRLDLSDQALLPPAELSGPEDFAQWLLKMVTPMSKGQVEVLKEQVEQGLSIPLVFKHFQQRWMAKEGRPALIECAGQKHLVAFPGEENGLLQSATEGPSHFLDECFAATIEPVAEIGEQARFRQIVKSQLARLKKRQKNIAVQQYQGGNFTERRHLGELLIANLHLIKKGMTEVTLTDWGIDPPVQVKIALQPDLSPQENAERLFKRYKKEKRGVEHIERRQQETADELDWLESLLLALDEAHEASDILEIGQELQKAGLIAVNKKEPVSRSRLSAEPRLNQTLSPGGLRIFWGRNNRSNDHLSAHLTDRDDLWFHAYNMPGCHLVLKRDGLKGVFAAADIEFAAQIAAGYSRGQQESRVEVIVTEGRHVSRLKGAKPGLVRVAEHRTLRVAPMRVTPEGKPPKD